MLVQIRDHIAHGGRNDDAWDIFHEAYWKGREDFFQPNVPLSSADIELWRRWMRNVFQPMNIKMEDVLTNNAQLLVGDKMPIIFSQLIAHTEAYKATIAKWTEPTGTEDKSPIANLSPLPFPKRPDLRDCITAEFHALKVLQQQLKEQLIGWPRSLQEELPSECNGPVLHKS